MSLWTRVRNAFRLERLDRDLDEELRLHVEAAIAAGRSPEEVRRRFGNVTRIRESSRDVKVLGWLAALLADTRFGWRQLRKNWKASAAAVLSLALSIGACTGAFRLIDALLLRPLPVADPRSLYCLSVPYFDHAGEEHDSEAFSYPIYLQMRDGVKGDADMLAVSYASRVDLTYGGDDAMEKAYRQYVSGNTFSNFGLRPAIGRLLGPSDDEKPGAHPVAVLSHAYWSSRFGRDPKVIGRKFRIGEQVFEIIGVAPPGFTGTETGAITAIFIPTMMNADAIHEAAWQWMRIWIRPRQGREVRRILEQMQSIYTAALRERLKNWRTDTSRERIERVLKARLALHSAAAGASDMQKDYRLALWILGGMVVLILLIACANVANLMIAQAAGRTREMALRIAIGAGRWRLMQLVLVESALVSIAATALGSVLAWWSAPWVISMVSSNSNPVGLVLPADWRVFGFAVLLTVSVTVLFGVVPAMRASGVKPISALKGERNRSKARLMHALVVGQVGFCFLVHFVAGLLVTTFERLSTQPLGFSANQVLLVVGGVKGTKHVPTEIWQQMAEQLRSVPNVEAASSSEWALMSGSGWDNFVRIPGRAQEAFMPYFLAVGPGFLSAMKIDLLAGRDFAPQDKQRTPAKGPESAGPAIVNEAFARRYFAGENPVGKFFYRSEGKSEMVREEVVGFVKDFRYNSMREPLSPIALFPLKEENWGTFVVRTSAGDPSSLAPALRARLARVRPEFQVSVVTSQQELVNNWTRRERLLAALSLFFAALALVLAAIGLYGVLSYSIEQRTREFGIRMALGAGASSLVRNVATPALRMLAVGALAGLAAGLLSGRLLATMLFSVHPTDFAIIAIPCLSLAGAALVAVIPPAIRAVRIDAAQALRAE